jgi:hypothetical protein
MGIEPDAYLKIGMPDGVTGAELRAFLTEREAALVGGRLLEDQGWKIGNRVTIRGRGRMPDLSFTIRGDIARDDRLGRVVIVRLDYLEEVLGAKGRASYIQVLATEAGIAPVVADAIDQRFANYTMPTETVTEKAHLAPFIASPLGRARGAAIVAVPRAGRDAARGGQQRRGRRARAHARDRHAAGDGLRPRARGGPRALRGARRRGGRRHVRRARGVCAVRDRTRRDPRCGASHIAATCRWSVRAALLSIPLGLVGRRAAGLERGAHDDQRRAAVHE